MIEKRRGRNSAGALFLALTTTLTFAGAANAQETITIAPGPEGEDVSYYSFLPLLLRGDYTTMYAHTAFSDTGSSHSMETFIKFPLPADLLEIAAPPGPGEMTTVLDAFLVMVFAFSFDHTGSPPPPGGELSLHEVIEDWQESTLNFANHPSSGLAFETNSEIDDLGPIVFDVSDSVRDWAHAVNENYGFKLSNPQDNPIGFHSFEANVDPALKAQLVITVPEPEGAGALAIGALLLGTLAAHRRQAFASRML